MTILETIEKYKMPKRDVFYYKKDANDEWKKYRAFVLDFENYDPVAAELWQIDVLNLYIRMKDAITGMASSSLGFRHEKEIELARVIADRTVQLANDETSTSLIKRIVEGDDKVLEIQMLVNDADAAIKYFETYAVTVQECIWYLRKSLEQLPNYEG